MEGQNGGGGAEEPKHSGFILEVLLTDLPMDWMGWERKRGIEDDVFVPEMEEPGRGEYSEFCLGEF